MKANLDLQCESSPAWLSAVMDDFPSFLQDHADCERKASSMAMSFVAKYPDRKEIIPELIDTAVEELEHFRSVHELMRKKDVPLPSKMKEDEYVKALIKQCHSGREERFMDRLLIASALETRGAERFRLIAGALEDDDLKKFYKMLWTSEAKHGHIFVKMALNYFPEKQVYDRLDTWMNREAEIIQQLPLRPALH
ncbi:MAG: tRNA-(ms[2]io[6]A)-hydroxylase [Bacteroidetes bacterium]|nr:tRNA-(ms[2]io[6]A)-hydroxylase [Bacteroidota bacterium]